MPDVSPPAIRATRLSKRFGVQAVLRDVSFEVAAGETLVLLGPSGCGKTTLLKLLNRLIEPDGGAVEINGRDVREQAPATLRRGIGYVIQQVGLLPHYTVAENVAVVPHLLGYAPAAVAARTSELLTRLHLPPARYAGQYPHQLSGGQQQRVGLARALAADPPIVLMDEPFGALDPLTRAGIRREFRELDELRRKTVVLVTHDVTEAFELADRILLLDAGQIQQLGTPRELLFRPANAFVRSFFAAERLALQLRTLTLDDVFGGNEAGKPASNAATTVINAAVTVINAAVADMNPAVTVIDVAVTDMNPAVTDINAAVTDMNAAAANMSAAVTNTNTGATDTNAAMTNTKSATLDTPSATPDVASDTLAVAGATPSSGVASPAFTPNTTVHEALERLTGPAPGAAPFTAAQLMAAFGAALQREEDAWKR